MLCGHATRGTCWKQICSHHSAEFCFEKEIRWWWHGTALAAASAKPHEQPVDEMPSLTAIVWDRNIKAGASLLSFSI